MLETIFFNTMAVCALECWLLIGNKFLPSIKHFRGAKIQTGASFFWHCTVSGTLQVIHFFSTLWKQQIALEIGVGVVVRWLHIDVRSGAMPDPRLTHLHDSHSHKIIGLQDGPSDRHGALGLWWKSDTTWKSGVATMLPKLELPTWELEILAVVLSRYIYPYSSSSSTSPQP